jgi:hypothetical protein
MCTLYTERLGAAAVAAHYSFDDALALQALCSPDALTEIVRTDELWRKHRTAEAASPPAPPAPDAMLL